MSASFVVNGSLVTITFEWPDVPVAKATNLIEYAALAVYDRDVTSSWPTAWANMTNQEKLDLVYQEAQRYIVRMAREKYVSESSDSARITAEQDIGVS